MKWNFFVLISLIISVSAPNSVIWAYKEEVHFKINEIAVDSSQLQPILKENLGFKDGVDTELKTNKIKKQIKQWIAYGGEEEDSGKPGLIKPLSTRAFNHFHDPLKDWKDAALDSIFNIAYRGRYYRDPISPILWGLEPGSQDFF
jgi:hypothetical protein